MLRLLLRSVRAYVGGVALALGCVGLFLFALAVPLTVVGANFWGSSGFPEGPPPSVVERDTAVSRTLHWAVDNRLAPLFAASLLLLAYGFYEAHVEQSA